MAQNFQSPGCFFTVSALLHKVNVEKEVSGEVRSESYCRCYKSDHGRGEAIKNLWLVNYSVAGCGCEISGIGNQVGRSTIGGEVTEP